MTGDSPAAQIGWSGAASPGGAGCPHGPVAGSFTAMMVLLAGAEGCGTQIGGKHDLVARAASRFLNPVRRDMIVPDKNANHAHIFLARAVIRATKGRQPDAPAQHLDVPDDTGRMPRPD